MEHANVNKGDLVIHNTAEFNFGIPMEVLDVKNSMVYCKHFIDSEEHIFSADWFPLDEIQRVLL